ncbi:MAG: hypothetical protein U5K72_14415 [Balneolaceae bacterium]|nr:hypothetical protein [Balneolaceae bacterium]
MAEEEDKRKLTVDNKQVSNNIYQQSAISNQQSAISNQQPVVTNHKPQTPTTNLHLKPAS